MDGTCEKEAYLLTVRLTADEKGDLITVIKAGIHACVCNNDRMAGRNLLRIMGLPNSEIP